MHTVLEFLIIRKVMLRLLSLEFEQIEIPAKILAKLNFQTRYVFVYLILATITNAVTDVMYILIAHLNDEGWIDHLLTLILPLQLLVFVCLISIWFLMYRCNLYLPGTMFVGTTLVLVLKFQQWIDVYNDYSEIGAS